MDQFPQQFRRVVTGRRAAARLRVRLPATLTLLSGPLRVILANLSEYGAGICVGPSRPDGLRVGADAVLSWHRFEGFGTICWLAHDHCGFMFETPIGQRELILTRALDARAHLPSERELRRGIARRWVDGEL